MPFDALSVHEQVKDVFADSLHRARNPLVRAGILYWRSLCGERKFPARDAITLRGMAQFIQLSVLARVVDNGSDYEYRFVGEAQRQAFRTYFKGMRVTQIEVAVPELGAILRSVYEQVRSTGIPLLLQGQVPHELPDSPIRYQETVFLPLGSSDDTVDNLLIVGVRVPNPFWEVPEEKLKALAAQLIQSAYPAN